MLPAWSHLFRSVRWLVAASGFGAAWITTNAAPDFYVDPVRGSDGDTGASVAHAFRSIERARQAVRTVNRAMDQDIHVLLRGGTYNLSQTLRFEPADSGSNGHFVRYQAYADEKPVVESVRTVSGWVLHDPKKGIYKAMVGDARPFRQLYVGGRPAIRARFPNLTDPATGEGYFKILNGVYAQGSTRPPFEIAAAEVGPFARDPRTEFHWNAKWGFFIAHSAGYSVHGALASVQIDATESKYRNVQTRNSKHPLYYWENSYEFLDAPGEWYWDGSTRGVKGSGWLYYIPRPGEDLTQVEVTIPVLETLIDLSGSGVDVALHGRAKASSSQPGFGPEQAFDGNFTRTLWRSANAGDKWLMVDLGAPHALSRFVINHNENVQPGAAATNTRAFRFETSVDGQAWTERYRVDNNTVNNSSQKASFTARYARVTITQAVQPGYDRDHDARISELALYETEEVHHLAFQGITFQYTNWSAPSEQGYSTNQAGLNFELGANTRYSTNIVPVPGMVQMAYTNHIGFERDQFRYSGSFGLRSMFDSSDTLVRGNRFEGCASGGVVLGVGTSLFDGRIWGCSVNDTIEENFISDCAAVYKDSPGINVTLAQHLRILHNEVARLPWAGITAGWNWTDTPFFGTHDNEIGGNQIHEVMRIQHDGAAIYLPGRQDRTRIHDNYVYNVPAPKNYGIYLDNGASYEVVADNVINNAHYAYQANVPTHDNVFSGNFHNSLKFDTDDNLDPKSGYKLNAVIHDTLVADQTWPQPARAIMAAAGIEAAYADIIPAGNPRPIGGAVENTYLDCTGYTIIPDEYLISPSRNSWAVLKRDGNFVVYDGPPGTINRGVLWQTGVTGPNDGRYYARPDVDGFFKIYRGTFRAQKPAVIHYQMRFTSEKSVYGFHVTMTDAKALSFGRDLSPEFSRGSVWSSSAPTALVYNLGHSGESSRDGVRRFAADVLPLRPTVTVIDFGMNDAVNEVKFTPIDEFERNLRQMVAAAQQAHSQCILVTVNPVVESALYHRHDPKLYAAQGGPNALVDRHNAVIRRMAKETGTALFDFQSLMSASVYNPRRPDSVISGDGVHPTAKGLQMLAQGVASVIAARRFDPARVACIGDSITWLGYPDKLAALLNPRTP